MIVSTLLATAGILTAKQDDRRDWIPFLVPSMPQPGGKAPDFDLSFLNPDRAGKHGFVKISGEKILDGKGKELRLFGTNICDLHVMPPKDMAPKIALRLKQLGFNAIRLHYYDYAPAPDGIMNPDMETINPAKRDEMDWLIYHLIENGIYVNINLHVLRGYPGLPAGTNPGGKVVDRLLPKLIESQKHFAKQMLTTVNPYTKRAYNDEPGIYAVELNNENSLLHNNTIDWSGIYTLPADVLAPVVKDWNKWLAAKYKSTAELTKAWTGNTAAGTKNLIVNGDFSNGLSRWEWEAGGGGTSKVLFGDGQLEWVVTKAGQASWHHQLHQTSVPLVPGKDYVLTFDISGTEGLEVDVRFMLQQDPWSNVSSLNRYRLSAKTQSVVMAFRAINPGNAPTRLSFSTNNQVGTVKLSKVELYEGSKPPTLAPNALEKGEVPLSVSTSGGLASNAVYQFMVDKELETLKTLKDYLKKDLKVKSPVIDTQVNYGGLVGLLRATKYEDFTDIHEYPAHPNEVGRTPTGGFIWSVPNSSMLREVKPVLERLGFWRIFGKPLTVSEFDLNPSNQYSVESFPMITLMASLQGWSGLNEYSWLNFQRGEENPTRMFHHFSTQGNTAQLATIPFCALMYRLGLVPALTAKREISLSEAKARLEPTDWGAMAALWKAAGGDTADAWTHRVGVNLKNSKLEPALQAPTANAKSPVTWKNVGTQKPELWLNTPAAKMLMGWAGDGQARVMGDVSIKMLPGTREGYGHIYVVAVDGKPIAESKRLMVTAVSRSENVDQTWADANKTIVNWGNGPVVSEPVEADIDLPGKGWKAFRLSGSGYKLGSASMVGSTLQARKADQTLWWILER